MEILCRDLKAVDINAKKNGNTPAIVAAKDGKNEILQFLFEKKADFTLKNNEEKAPIHVAIEQDNDSTIKWFTDKKITLNLKMSKAPFLSPMGLAATKRKSNVVTALLKAGADYPLDKKEWEQLDHKAKCILLNARKKEYSGKMFSARQELKQDSSFPIQLTTASAKHKL